MSAVSGSGRLRARVGTLRDSSGITVAEVIAEPIAEPVIAADADEAAPRGDSLDHNSRSVLAAAAAR